MRPRGIPEIPRQSIKKIVAQDGTVHEISELTDQHQQFFSDVREQLLQLRQRQAIPDAPTNVKATGQAFSNLIQWTRSADADYYEILHSLTPSLTDPHFQTTDVGNSALWVDHIGQNNITKFYWVRARKRTGASSLEVGPAKATTVASATGVTPPIPPPASNILILDQATGRVSSYLLSGSNRSLNNA